MANKLFRTGVSWPFACISCGASGNDEDFVDNQEFTLSAGSTKTEQKLGLGKVITTRHHSVQGIAYLCENCHKKVLKEIEYKQNKSNRYKKIGKSLISIMIILLPLSLLFFFLGSDKIIEIPPENSFMSLWNATLLIIPTIGILGVSAFDRSSRFKREDWPLSYAKAELRIESRVLVGYKFKFFSKEYAEIFQSINKGYVVEVDDSIGKGNLELPNGYSLIVGGFIPLFTLFVLMILLSLIFP